MKWSEVAQLCSTLCDLVDYSPPGSSVHGILQARILEWVVISLSRGSSQPRDRTQVSRIAGRGFNLWTTREAHHIGILQCKWHKVKLKLRVSQRANLSAYVTKTDTSDPRWEWIQQFKVWQRLWLLFIFLLFFPWCWYVMGWIVSPTNSYVEILTPST